MLRRVILAAVNRTLRVRGIQRNVHPRTFPQTLVLTDGSTICVRSTTPGKPVLRLLSDSLSHPSWNPNARERMLNQQNPHLARFAQRFGSDSTADLFGAE